MKFLIFTDEEIDGDGEEEKVPPFESIVNGEDEDEEAWIVILIWCFYFLQSATSCFTCLVLFWLLFGVFLYLKFVKTTHLSFYMHYKSSLFVCTWLQELIWIEIDYKNNMKLDM